MAAVPKTKEIRTYLFDAEKWTPGEARDYLRKKNKRAPATVYRDDLLSYKQEPPFKFKAGTSKQITLSKPRGIMAIVATPKKPEKPATEKKKKTSTESKPTRRPTDNKKGVKRKMTTKALAKKEVKAPTKRRKKSTSVLGGIHFGQAFRDLIPLFCGALICKFTAKKFVEGGGDREDWDWKNYLLGLAGTMVAAFLSSAVFRGKGRVATAVFKGGLLLFFYKLFVNELVPKSEWLISWFGQAEDIYPDMSEDMDLDEGDVYRGSEGDVVYDDVGRYRPIDDMHRQPAVAQMGVVIEERDPNFGYEISPADETFGAAGGQTLNQRYAAAQMAAGGGY